MIRLGHPLYIHTCSTRICLPVILPRATPTENSERDQYRQNGKSRADLAHFRARYYLVNPDATVTTFFRNNTRSQPRTIALLRKSIHPLFASCCLFVHLYSVHTGRDSYNTGHAVSYSLAHGRLQEHGPGNHVFTVGSGLNPDELSRSFLMNSLQ